MSDESQYEIRKQANKQKLVRNEFLYYGMSAGKFDFPVIKKQKIDLGDLKFISFADVKKDDTENADKIVHFFTYDWIFEKVYDNTDEEIAKLGRFKALLSPDFSIFTNMPMALQIYNIFKNRWCGAFWQQNGLKVIPTVSWGDRNSFSFCFDGIEKGSVVAVSTYCRENAEEEFLLGYNKMLEIIEPEAVICYDEPFPSMKGNIIEVLPTTYEWTKKLDKKDLLQFKWEKRHRNVSGLNEKDFKFFKYDDPYKKDIITNCPICSKVALSDKYGNGECKNCGWKFSRGDVDPEDITYPMLVSLSVAREQYKHGKPFKATFKNFIGGLAFYAEMTFVYENKKYAVFHYADDSVEMGYDEDVSVYSSIADFEKNGAIGGKLLSDIWEEVKNPSFMACG